jgi:hypothetical protein
METGYIKINIEEGKTPLVEAQLADDNNLWLSKWEIARLFGCFVQKVDANLRSIFKQHLLWEKDCSYCNRYTDKGVEKQTVYYNLEVLIFLSYRIASFEAEIFRQFLHSALEERLQKKEIKDGTKLIWSFMNGQDYCWN